jgi:hypothetical protein
MASFLEDVLGKTGLKKIFGPDKDEVSNLGYYSTWNFVIYTGNWNLASVNDRVIHRLGILHAEILRPLQGCERLLIEGDTLAV